MDAYCYLVGFWFLRVDNTGLKYFFLSGQSSPQWIIMQCFLLHDQQHDNIPRVNIFLIGDLISEIEFIERYDCGQIHVEMNELLESIIKNPMDALKGNLFRNSWFNFWKCSDIDLFKGVTAYTTPSSGEYHHV